MTDHTVPCVEGDWPGCIPSCGADHDGHTINVGPVTVGIDTDALRSAVCLRSDGVAHATLALCDEVDRLRAENTALAAAKVQEAES